jgi:hypothetical protein
MDYHKNAPWTAISREQLAGMVISDGMTLRSAAVRFNVSAKTAAKGVGRYRQFGVAGMADRSSRPQHSPHRCRAGAQSHGEARTCGVRMTRAGVGSCFPRSQKRDLGHPVRARADFAVFAGCAGEHCCRAGAQSHGEARARGVRMTSRKTFLLLRVTRAGERCAFQILEARPVMPVTCWTRPTQVVRRCII